MRVFLASCLRASETGTVSGPAGKSADLASVFLTSRRDLESFLRRRVRSPQVAEDLASDIYLKLDRVENFSGDESDARGYLFRMAANIATDHERVANRRVQILEEERDLFDSVTESSEAAVVAKSRIRVIDAALDELPAKARDFLWHSRVDEMTHGEIAEQMGVSKSLIEKYIMRALAHCRQRLREAEDDGRATRRLAAAASEAATLPKAAQEG